MTSISHTPPTIHDVTLVDVNQYDIWDRRECAIANENVWKSACETYKSSSDFLGGIPLTMHQIWIGSRQPPCVWLDTWRIDFMRNFASSPQNDKKWQHRMWDNHAVQNMSMMNRDIFDAETAPQCQADILRLEILYQYGGVYVDADIVSTQRDLRPALKSAQQTGFLITYEPDTKDKPYSVLGNSLIACTPKHPLILMLMAYIKQIYGFKRAHYGVEWVTGPLTYTKVLIHPDMPITVPPSKDFYPAFHYVPNPSTIDVTTFDSYCFQFGYTCSGLSQWVAANNKCRKAHHCSHHAKIDYPLGKLKQFPDTFPHTPTDLVIPKIIHQFSFQSEQLRPARWTSTWSDNFCPSTGFEYKLWTWERLRSEIGSFYCANLFIKEKMDAYSIQMLALEVIQHYGGYYIPLTTTFAGNQNDPELAASLFGTEQQSFFKRGSIFGSVPSNCRKLIKDCYDSGAVEFRTEGALPPALVEDMNIGDEEAGFTAFKDGSRFLGAGRIFYAPRIEEDSKKAHSARAAMIWAYDCQVPVFNLESEDSVISCLNSTEGRAIVITNSLFGVFSSLVNELPGVMYRLDEEEKDWDYIVFNVEWEADKDGFDVYQAASPFRSPHARYLGFVANAKAATTVDSIDVEQILAQYESGRVFVASEKSKHSSKLDSIFRTMPLIDTAFQTLADHNPDFSRDYDEVHENLFKGFRHGQLAFELQVDEEQRVMFRSWASSGEIDCECRIQPSVNGIAIENLRRYQNGQVLYETSGEFLR